MSSSGVGREAMSSSIVGCDDERLDIFARLPTAILSKVWPAERALMGARVCSWMHRDLLQLLEQVVLRQASEIPDEERLRSEIFQVRSSLTDLKIVPRYTLQFCLPQVLQVCSKLARLDLSSQQEKDDEGWVGAERWGGAWQGVLSQMSVSHLTIRSCAEKGVETLVSGGCPHLQHLDFSNSAELGSSTIFALADALEHCTTLTSVNFSDCGCIEQDDSGAEALVRLLHKCSNLTSLDLSRIGLKNGRAEVLANGLRTCTKLQEIRFAGRWDRDFSPPWNDIRDGVVHLSTWFALCKDLQVLDLAHNGVAPAGARALGEALPELPQLRWMDLQNNLLQNAGARKLEWGLGQCTSLQYLNVSGCRIGDVGATALAIALAQCRSLQHLEIEARHARFPGMPRVDLSDEGATALARELSVHRTSLKYLNMAGNQIGDGGAAVLGEELAACRGLRQVDVSDNLVGERAVMALLERLQHCTVSVFRSCPRFGLPWAEGDEEYWRGEQACVR